MDVKTKWNTKYIDRIDQQKPVRPNERLKEMTFHLMGGTALDLACGQGGNSLFLAQMNFQVQSLDISDVAITYLKEQAAKSQLDINAKVANLADTANLQLKNDFYDLVVITYYLDRALFPLVKRILKNQGYFFMETFYQTPILQERQIPEQFKLQSKELLNEFKDWEVLFFEEDAEEGHQTIFCRKR